MTDLATGLSTADTAELRALAARVEQAHAAVNAAQAELTRAFAEAERFATRVASASPRSVRERDMTRRAVAAEIAVPLRISDRGVQQKMHDALTLVEDYPATMTAWETGLIGQGHVHAVTDAGAVLPVEDRRAFDEHAAGICARQSVTRSKEALGILAERLHPRTATERHRDARTRRGVWVSPLGEGMSRVVAEVPTVLGEGIHDRLHRLAAAFVDARAAAKTRIREDRADGVPEHELDPGDCILAEDSRAVDEVRADILCDLLLTGTPDTDPTVTGDGPGVLGAIRAHVQVVVTATTLAGMNEDPADLVGAAPVDAATARELAGDCTGWDRVFTHPVTGQVLATDRYTPTLDLRRRLRARDRHCRFPGCRTPAIRCEHDHTIDHALGGPTRLENLAGLCQRHHSMKQFTPWQVRQLGDGILEWTSPTGRLYTDDPPTPAVFFTPTSDPPPF